MLRWALRRALWTFPALVAVSLVAFALLARLPAPAWERDAPDRALAAPRPTFVNARPTDVRELATSAVTDLVEGRDPAGAAARLARLGGAALPHVLPDLDVLAPQDRAKVALALAPVAARMGLERAGGLGSGADAVAFWQRFWLERSADFRPSVVRRAVRRLAARGSEARRAELVELDTFALDELLAALGEVRDGDDVERVARLLQVAAHVSSRDPCVRDAATVAVARQCVARWRLWWLEARADFVPLTGPARLAATLLETRYGRWALGAVTLRLGVGPDGVSVLEKLRDRGPVTAALCAGAMSLAHAAAALLGLVAARLGGGAADRAIGALLAALYAVPSVLVAWALARAFGPSAALAVPALAVAVSLVASPASQERMAALEALRLDAARAARARGASWPRLLFVHTLRSTALVPATLFGLDLPIALTGACVVERAFGIGGLGEDIVTAIRTHDVSFLMAFGICSAAITAALLVGADAACALLDPRFRELIAKESA